MAETGTTQAKEAYEKMSAATAEATDLIRNNYSTAVEGAGALPNSQPPTPDLRGTVGDVSTS